MKNFKVGDVIILKSGSPKMTIRGDEQNTSSGRIECNWYDEGQIKHHSFYEDQIEIASEDESSFI